MASRAILNEGLTQRGAISAPSCACAVPRTRDKQLGGEFRRKVIDFALENDLQQGVKFVARAGDFNNLGWGPRERIVRDANAAITALVTHPSIPDYRRFLNPSLPLRAESNPTAAHPNARKIGPAERNQARTSIIASDTLDHDSPENVLHQLPPAATRLIFSGLVSARPSQTLADLQQAALSLDVISSERDNLLRLESLAGQWASLLIDPTMRRHALKKMAAGVGPQEVAELLILALSKELFRNAPSGIPAKDRAARISHSIQAAFQQGAPSIPIVEIVVIP